MKSGLTPAIPAPLRNLQHLVAALICGFAVLSAAAPAQAGFKFGSEENLRQLADVKLQNSAKEALFIGHKVTFYWIGMPATVSDDGYILGVKGKSVYYPLDKERLAEWQAQGLLPNPLPTYELHLADYVFGHLLWIVLACWGAWKGSRHLLSRRASKPAATAPVGPPAPPPARVAQAIGSSHAVKASSAATQVVPEPSKAVSETSATATVAPPIHSVPTAPRANAPAAPSSPPPIPRPEAARPLPTIAQMRAEAAKLPVAKTVCRVKVTKAA